MGAQGSDPLLPRAPSVLFIAIVFFGATELDSKGAHMVRERGTNLHTFARAGTAIVALIALGNCLVFGQGSTASITGVVKDATGALVPGVSISVKHVENGLTRTAVTTEN